MAQGVRGMTPGLIWQEGRDGSCYGMHLLFGLLRELQYRWPHRQARVAAMPLLWLDGLP